eukprot:SAG11_NODE_44_length_20765_cov_5.183635_12_plen_549_part_00
MACCCGCSAGATSKLYVFAQVSTDRCHTSHRICTAVFETSMSLLLRLLRSRRRLRLEALRLLHIICLGGNEGERLLHADCIVAFQRLLELEHRLLFAKTTTMHDIEKEAYFISKIAVRLLATNTSEDHGGLQIRISPLLKLLSEYVRTPGTARMTQIASSLSRDSSSTATQIAVFTAVGEIGAGNSTTQQVIVNIFLSSILRILTTQIDADATDVTLPDTVAATVLRLDRLDGASQALITERLLELVTSDVTGVRSRIVNLLADIGDSGIFGSGVSNAVQTSIAVETGSLPILDQSLREQEAPPEPEAVIHVEAHIAVETLPMLDRSLREQDVQPEPEPEISCAPTQPNPDFYASVRGFIDKLERSEGLGDTVRYIEAVNGLDGVSAANSVVAEVIVSCPNTARLVTLTVERVAAAVQLQGGAAALNLIDLLCKLLQPDVLTSPLVQAMAVGTVDQLSSSSVFRPLLRGSASSALALMMQSVKPAFRAVESDLRPPTRFGQQSDKVILGIHACRTFCKLFAPEHRHAGEESKTRRLVEATMGEPSPTS